MLILTETSALYCDDTSATVHPHELLQGKEIRCGCAAGSSAAVACADGSIAVVVDGRIGAVVESDIDDRIECLEIIGDEPIELLIGTEPAHIFRLVSGGPAARLQAFDDLECQSTWYTPWGGPPAVRSFAHAHDTLYADIHVGSIMRSADRGSSWEPVTAHLDDDVHQVVTCAAAPMRVFANTADAVFVSEDEGQTWEHRANELPARYGRAIAVHPADCDCLLASISDGPHSDVNGQLYRSGDAGRNWIHVTAGFPSELSDNLDTFQLGFSATGRAWAAVEERLYVSEDRGMEWTVAWEATAKISSIAC